MLMHMFRRTVGTPPGMVTTYNTVHVIGAGGNGAPMLMRLYKMHTQLLALGRPGLNVVLWDMDTVSRFNLGRQPFYPSDIGKNKATLLIDRVKSIDATVSNWQAKVERFTDDSQVGHGVLAVITCVDNNAARRSVHKAVFEKERALYWLDMGNEADTGQVVLGESMHRERKLRLPVVTEIFPSILDESIPESDAPSCSAEEAIRKQSLFINELVVVQAAKLLWDGLFDGVITKPIVFVNSKSSTTQSIGIDRAFYKRKGIKTGRRANPLTIEA